MICSSRECRPYVTDDQVSWMLLISTIGVTMLVIACGFISTKDEPVVVTGAIAVYMYYGVISSFVLCFVFQTSDRNSMMRMITLILQFVFMFTIACYGSLRKQSCKNETIETPEQNVNDGSYKILINNL